MHRQPSTVKLYIRHNTYGERHRRADSQSELRKQSPVHDGTARQDTCGFWRRAITFDMLNPGATTKSKRSRAELVAQSTSGVRSGWRYIRTVAKAYPNLCTAQSPFIAWLRN